MRMLKPEGKMMSCELPWPTSNMWISKLPGTQRLVVVFT